MPYLINTKTGEKGPFSSEQIQKFLAEGQIKEETNIKDQVSGELIPAKYAADPNFKVLTAEAEPDQEADNPYEAPKTRARRSRSARPTKGKKKSKELSEDQIAGRKARNLAMYIFLGSLAFSITGIIFREALKGVGAFGNLILWLSFLIGLLQSLACFRYFSRTKEKSLLFSGILWTALNGFGFAANTYVLVIIYTVFG